MRVKIASEGRRFTIPLPNCVILGSASAAIIAWVMNNKMNNMPEDTNISYRDIRKLFKEIRRCRRYLKGEPLVYARSSDGDGVEIYL